MSILQAIIAILFVCCLIGLAIIQLLLKKYSSKKRLKLMTIFLLGVVVGFAIFLKATTTSLIIYLVILGFLSNHFIFETKIDMYLFSLITSILAFIYMLFLVFLIKITVSSFRVPRILLFSVESILVFLAIYLSLSFLSTEVIVPLYSSDFGKIVISVLLTLIYSGLGSIFDEGDPGKDK
ncbi:hypothetical protein [Sutcliffiella halmapala]|uniref:hypothetical protein n=1 Tax=Sutcliffiella halmapala TaxID=79882 RepID=UPI000994D82F|nr:hypothetical protein [Sutcliffiella halmapala]